VKRYVPALDPDVQSLLAEVRLPRPLPDTVRARALARARAIVTVAVSPAHAARSKPRSLWLALIVVGGLVAGVALGAAAGALAALVVDASRERLPHASNPPASSAGEIRQWDSAQLPEPVRVGR
jgi:hypothetical protein